MAATCKEMFIHYFNTNRGPVKLSLLCRKKDWMYNWRISTLYCNKFHEQMHDGCWKSDYQRALDDGKDVLNQEFKDVTPIEDSSVLENIIIGKTSRIDEFKDRISSILKEEFPDLHFVDL